MTNDAQARTQDAGTENLRIRSIRPLLPPEILKEELPITQTVAETVNTGRRGITAALDGEDDRLVVVVGPCSIHDRAAGLEYGQRLREEARRLGDDLHIVMRVYFEKPRTTIGWKGLINDPHLDGSFRINDGLRAARGLLLDLGELGLPCGTEFLDPITPQFISGLISWGAIGARTTESQTHRQVASGLSMPIGFKNGTRGTVSIAIDAVASAKHPHRFLGVTSQGLAAIVSTAGNPSCHVILRGGTTAPNFDAASIKSVSDALVAARQRNKVMVDCSHGNSGKDHVRQKEVCGMVAGQIAEGQKSIAGVMLESFLVEGKQSMSDPANLVYGQSITDACMGWDATQEVLEKFASAVRARRKN